MLENYFYIAPIESVEYIERDGILTPREVKKLIKIGELPESVLGISYKGVAASHFLDYVSLVDNVSAIRDVAAGICYARTGRYSGVNFKMKCYEISSEIKKSFNFIPHSKVEEMWADCYKHEVLFRGRVGKENIIRSKII